MTDYTTLHYNMNAWIDGLNDAYEHKKPDSFGDAHHSRFMQYAYAYLSCINEYSDDHE